jgi:serine/threonine-protein kinase
MLEGDPQGPVPSVVGAADPLIGRILNDRFRILSPLGSGGMGKVYKAVQTPLDRVVALKILNPNFPAEKDPAFKRRFFLEASLTSKLRHPNTVTVIDYGQTEDGIYFIAMEYMEGQTLAEVLAHDKTLPWRRVLDIAQQICRSLREAHKLGVIHRDLKPANVMLLNEADHDMVKVLDFGLVKSFLAADGAAGDPEVTQNGVFLGSPQYMAPEQARNVADPRSDVPDARRSAPVPGQGLPRGHLPAHEGVAARGAGDQPHHRPAARGRGAGPPVPPEGPGAALPVDGRGARGPA